MSLKNLLALQKQKAAAESANVAVAPTPPAAAVAESESKPEASAPAKPAGLGLNLVKSGQKFEPAAKPTPPKPAPAKTEVFDGGQFNLSDIAALTAEDVPATDSTRYAGSGFDDEIEATAPDRELPADLTTEQLAFVESLDGVYQVLHDAELFSQTVRLIMMELQENPEYEKLLSDPDVHTMIRGMRRTMGLARVRKQEKSRKTAGNANARKKAGVSDDAMALLNSLMGGGDD